MQIANWLEKTLMLGKLKAQGKEGDRTWGGWMALLMQWIWTWANSRRWWGPGKPGVLQSIGLWRVRHELATEQWTTAIHFYRGIFPTEVEPRHLYCSHILYCLSNEGRPYFYIISTFALHKWTSPLFFVCMLNHFSHDRLFATLWTVGRQASLPIGFSRK